MKTREYDHSKESFVEAAGFTKEEYKELRNKVCEMHKKHDCMSEIMEAMENEFEPREMALMTMDAFIRMAKRAMLQDFKDMMQQRESNPIDRLFDILERISNDSQRHKPVRQEQE